MALICILVFNLESYEYFRPVFVDILCHSFMRFAEVIFFRCLENCPRGKLPPVRVRVWFGGNFPRGAGGAIFLEPVFPMKLYKKIYLHGKFIIEFLFLLPHMFPWMNKFPITENMFLPRLVK